MCLMWARSHRFAKVASTSFKAPFVTLCDYTRVPGVVVGVWRHLLLLDTTWNGGGVELLNWRTQTTGTALLPYFPDLASVPLCVSPLVPKRCASLEAFSISWCFRSIYWLYGSTA